MVIGMRPPEDANPIPVEAVAVGSHVKFSDDAKLKPRRIEQSSTSSLANLHSSLVSISEEARQERAVLSSPRSAQDAREQAKRQKIQNVLHDDAARSAWLGYVPESFQNLHHPDEPYQPDVETDKVVPKLPTSIPWFAPTQTRQEFVNEALGNVRDASQLMKILSQHGLDSLLKEDQVVEETKRKLDDISTGVPDLIKKVHGELDGIDHDRMQIFDKARKWDALEFHRSDGDNQYLPPKFIEPEELLRRA